MSVIRIASPVFARIVKTKKESLGDYLVRWYEYILSLDAAECALTAVQKQEKATKVIKEKVIMDI
jgi:glutamyl-tRNA synthetase